MSNGTDLRVSRSLELLHRLERTAAEFAQKEVQLTTEWRNHRYKANRKHSVATQDATDHLDAQIAKVDGHFHEEAEQLRALYARRREAVERAQTQSLRTLPRRIEQARGRWLGRLQMQRIRLEREIGAGKQAAKQAHAETDAQLAEQQKQLTKLFKKTTTAFKGYAPFTKLLQNETATIPSEQPTTEQVAERIQEAAAKLTTFQQHLLPRLFSNMPLFLGVLAVIIAGVALAYGLGFNPTAWAVAGGSAGALIIGLLVIYRNGAQQGLPAAEALAQSLSNAQATLQQASTTAATVHQDLREKLQTQFDEQSATLQQQWEKADDVGADFAATSKQKLETQVPRLLAKIARALQSKLDGLDQDRNAQVQQLKATAQSQIDAIKSAQNQDLGTVVGDEASQWQGVEEDWKRRMIPVYQGIESMQAATSERFPAWVPALAQTWQPPTDFSAAVKFASLQLDLAQGELKAPQGERLPLPGPAQLSIPLALTFPHQGSLLFETKDTADATVGGIFNNIILRLLTTTPPGKLSFTIVDPIGLGQNFAGLMHLSDYEDSLINRRIWTQRDQIEDRLGELSEHVEKVIQMYLRNEYATITEYNEQAGSVAEKYYFVVIADFPANFSETAAKRLQSIATSGARCGIYTLIHCDTRQQMPDGFSLDDLRQSSVCVQRGPHAFFILDDHGPTSAQLVFDPPPAPDLMLSLVQQIGKSSVDSNRVQVPFSQIAPKPGEEWTHTTTQELRIAVGRTGATKLQYLAIGKGTKQHALFAGKTGSGKSTLFHVIITNLALACSPEQVEFYLIDFKKGVEFKCYASKRLPHARVVAIESDREFALSVLQRVDAELKRRGDLFRKLGVQDVAGYVRAGGTEPMPRSLLLIDEFQEFFVEDDTVAQTASLLFDRIVRQGRAFGIHVLLGSQTLGGSYSLARATLGQMVIRVALQCNEADAYLIMDENNSAPRLLSRPGEGIYNDAAGALEGNSPFQVVWLPDDERDVCLDRITALAEQSGKPIASPIVFEGNAPAELRENDLLRQALITKPTAIPSAGRVWMGAPNSIKGPTEAIFRRQSGNHLLIVGQREEAAVTMLGVALIALAAQFPAGSVKFVIFQGSPTGSPDADFLDGIAEHLHHPVQIARGGDLGPVMSELAAEMKARTTSDSAARGAPTVFLLVHGLHKFKKLRQEDDFSFSMSDDSSENTGAQFNALITEGSTVGMHILTTVDTFNNVNRSMNRKALSEFEMRVIFQMSANDSASLIDSPKASTLGLHRALFYNEHDGTLETFRPYALPDASWLAEARQAVQ